MEADRSTLITLNAQQSLALRQVIAAMRWDDSIYTACPDVVRKGLCDLLLPSYTTAEAQILDLKIQVHQLLNLCEKLKKQLDTYTAKAGRV